MLFHSYPPTSDTCCLAGLSHALQGCFMGNASNKVYIVFDCRGSLLTQLHPSHLPRCPGTRAQARASSSSPSSAAPPAPLPQPHRYCPCLPSLCILEVTVYIHIASRVARYSLMLAPADGVLLCKHLTKFTSREFRSSGGKGGGGGTRLP